MVLGLHTAIVMPFLNGKIDYKNLEKIIDFQHKSGVDGIVLNGTTGEAPTITDNEFVESANYVLEKWADKLHITIGISSNSAADLVKKESVLQIKPHAFLVTPPSYSKPSQEGIYRHFEALAKNTDVPIIVYNVPSRTVSDVLPETLKKLTENFKNIVGIKDATGSFPRFVAEQFLLKHNKNFSFLTGDDPTSLHFLLSGGHGIVSVVSNIVPNLVKKMIDLTLQNKKDEAFDILFKLFNITRLMFVETNPMPVKYAMYRMGFCSLEYRLPMCEPSKNLCLEIDEELKKLNLI